MNPQLEQLILLQDVDLMIREITDKKTASKMTRIGFEVDAVDNLQKARDDLAKKINADLLASYDRLMGRYPRAISPVRKSICLACFMKQPTRYSSADDTIRFCSHCNRFLYFI